MITHTNHIPLAYPTGILDHLRSITTTPWHPHAQGYTVSYKLQGWPEFSLMEGRVVPPHSDGIAGYRPLLILANPGYIIRGCAGGKVQAYGPQKPGDMLVLDIDAQHEVWGDPFSDKGSWSALVWGSAGEACHKDFWWADKVARIAKEKFSEFLAAVSNE